MRFNEFDFLRALTGALVLAVFSGVSGCGQTEVKTPVFPVSGSIKVGKEIPVGAQIVLHPKGHALPPRVSPVGRVGTDGTFKVAIYEGEEGVPAGEYVATVAWYKIVKGSGNESFSGPNVIPAKYTNPATSPLAVTVMNTPTVIPPIVIK